MAGSVPDRLPAGARVGDAAMLVLALAAIVVGRLLLGRLRRRFA
jgi:hypothetical protein